MVLSATGENSRQNDQAITPTPSTGARWWISVRVARARSESPTHLKACFQAVDSDPRPQWSAQLCERSRSMPRREEAEPASGSYSRERRRRQLFLLATGRRRPEFRCAPPLPTCTRKSGPRARSDSPARDLPRSIAKSCRRAAVVPSSMHELSAPLSADSLVQAPSASLRKLGRR